MKTLDMTSLKQQLQQVKSPIYSACSLPPVCYSSPEILELEDKYIFRENWIGIGRADQCRNTGDYTTLDITGIPIIVVRDNKNKLRAFANSCRHRGAKLLEGNGNCQAIRCPFHRWTYALDGKLLIAPRIENGEILDYEQYGLVEILLAERSGFVFLSLKSDVENIDEYLGDFEQLHSPWALDDLVTYKRHEFDVNCNWKAFLDVFNEYYHLPYVHPDSISNVYLQPEPGEKVTGKFASQFGVTEGTGGLLEATQQYSLPKMDSLDDRNANGARYSWIFPNMTFAAGTESVWAYEAYPITPQSSHIVLTLSFPTATTTLENFDQCAEQYFDRLIAAIEEDIPALENQQLGLNSPLAKQGRFNEELEPNVANFAFWYAKQFSELT